MADEFTIPVPASIEAPDAMPLDQAIDLACEKLGLPLLGGPSGRGWSYFSVAQRCPHLFGLQRASGGVRSTPAAPLQVGGLYHTLQSLYYGHGLGPAVGTQRGLMSATVMDGFVQRFGREGAKTLRALQLEAAEIPADAADRLLAELKALADGTRNLQASVDGTEPIKLPSAALIYEAERLFDAHTSFYGEGREDVTPLAVEWLAVNNALGYTCRYDMIGALGPGDPLVVGGALPVGSVLIYERKTSAYLSEAVTDGWWLDGEVLGEILNWEPSGCAALFGPLAGVIVDIVTKAKVPKFHQVLLPADLATVAEHERWIRYTNSEIGLWEATGVYPKRFTQCFDRWGKCGNWQNCREGR